MNKLNDFAALLEKQLLNQLVFSRVDCQTNRDNVKTSIKPGKKYTKVDIGGAGRYMIDNATGEIFGIKGYGQIHKGHKFGTLDTTSQWYWGNYTACGWDATNMKPSDLKEVADLPSASH